jgi:hypothetical protein
LTRDRPDLGGVEADWVFRVDTEASHADDSLVEITISGSTPHLPEQAPERMVD